MKSTLLAGLALMVLLLPSVAVAGPQPVSYYLKDGPMGPLGDGGLNKTRPAGTQASIRPIPVGISGAAPATFVTSGAKHPDRILGPLYLALWTGPAVTLKGNLTATVFIQNGTSHKAIGNASMILDANASKLPAPTALVPPPPTLPPDPTSDPQAIALYEVYQLYPALVPPAQLLYLGYVNAMVSPTDPIGVSFAITPGSSTLPEPQGVAGSVQYNATGTPSFLYVPWYVPSAPSTYTPVRYTYPTRGGPTTDAFGGATTDSPGQPQEAPRGVPGFATTIALAALATAFVVWRRRAA